MQQLCCTGGPQGTRDSHFSLGMGLETEVILPAKLLASMEFSPDRTSGEAWTCNRL